MKKYTYILILFFISCNTVRFDVVRSCHDGDTFITGAGEIIRLSNVDAPEIGQEFGYEAKQFLSRAILNKIVKLVTHGKDKYGRTIADVYVGGVYINEMGIKKGMAWAYKRFSSIKLYNEYLIAKKNKVGLWAYNGQIPPFLWRSKHKKINHGN